MAAKFRFTKHTRRLEALDTLPGDQQLCACPPLCALLAEPPPTPQRNAAHDRLQKFLDGGHVELNTSRCVRLPPRHFNVFDVLSLKNKLFKDPGLFLCMACPFQLIYSLLKGIAVDVASCSHKGGLGECDPGAGLAY